MSKSDRRDFMKGAGVAAAAVGVVATGMLVPTEANAETVTINPKATAMLPNGVHATREQILTKLGLDPSTAADGWLNIFNCGINALALSKDQLETLSKAGKLKGLPAVDVKTIQRIRGVQISH